MWSMSCSPLPNARADKSASTRYARSIATFICSARDGGLILNIRGAGESMPVHERAQTPVPGSEDLLRRNRKSFSTPPYPLPAGSPFLGRACGICSRVSIISSHIVISLFVHCDGSPNLLLDSLDLSRLHLFGAIYPLPTLSRVLQYSRRTPACCRK